MRWRVGVVLCFLTAYMAIGCREPLKLIDVDATGTDGEHISTTAGRHLNLRFEQPAQS